MLLRWELTYRCNLRCQHCLVSGGKEYRGGSLSAVERRYVLESLKETPVRTIQFIGGEPLICPDLPELIELARDLGVESSVATNGTLVNGALAQRLLFSGLDAISVSLDGGHADIHDMTRGNGNFDAAMSGIEHLVAIRAQHPLRVSPRLRIFTDVTITSMNIQDLVSIVDLSADLGLDAVIFNRMDRLGRALKNAHLVVSFCDIERSCYQAALRANQRGIPISVPIPEPLRMKWHKSFCVSLIEGLGRCENVRYAPCQAGGAVCVLRPDGTLDPCCHVKCNKYPSMDPDDSARKVPSVGFKNAYSDPAMNRFFEAVQVGMLSPPSGKCAHCANHAFYGGVCHPQCPLTFRDIEKDHPTICLEAICGGFEKLKERHPDLAGSNM